MIKRIVGFLLFVLLMLSLGLVVTADNPGTCKNPNGGNYCGDKSLVSECYCDKDCTKIGDCCTDYQQVCLNINPQLCTDTDNGKNYFLKGTTTGQSVSRTDFCYSSTQLHEYYCDPSAQVAFVLTTCPTTCSNGACLNQVTKNEVTDYISKCTSTSTAATKEQVLNYVNDKCSDTPTVPVNCTSPPIPNTISSPTVSSLAPTSGPIGTIVTITGSRFTATGNNVNFGSLTIPNLPSMQGTSIKFSVPSGTTSGTTAVSVTNANGTSNQMSFTVTPLASSGTNKRVTVIKDVKIYSDASISANELGAVPASFFGTVRCDLAAQPCPRNADGYMWWYIDWDDSPIPLPTGWSVEKDALSNYLKFSNFPAVIGADGSLRVSTVDDKFGAMLGLVNGPGTEYPVLVLGNLGTTVALSTPNLAYGLESRFINGWENGNLAEGNTCTSPCVASLVLFTTKDNCPFNGATCGVRVSASVQGTEAATSPFIDLHTAEEMRRDIFSEPFSPTTPDQIFYGPITTPIRIVALKVGKDSASRSFLHIDGLGFEQAADASLKKLWLDPQNRQGLVSPPGDNIVTISDSGGNVLYFDQLAAVTPTAATDIFGYIPDATSPGPNYLLSTHFMPGEDLRSKNTIFPKGTLVIIMPMAFTPPPGSKITVSNARGSHTVVYGVPAQPTPPPPPPPTFGPQPATNAFKIIGANGCYAGKLCPGYRASSDFTVGGSYAVIVEGTGMKPGVVFDVYSNNKATVLGTLTPFFTDGIGELYCVSESNAGGGHCMVAFVLPVPLEWAPNTYWARARNTDGTVSNFAAIVVTSSNQLPASLNTPNSNWVDSVTILNSLVSFTATQGKTYTIDVYGWNFKDGAKIVLCPHGRSSTFSTPGQPVLPGTCATQIEIPTTKLGLGHLQAMYTIPTDLNLGGYIAFVKNPGGELGLGGNLINAYYADQNVPDDPKISVSPISGPVGTTFTFKSDCSFTRPDYLTIVGKVNSGSLIVPAKPASPQGSVCGVSLTMSSTLQGQKDLPPPDDAIDSATISPGFYEVRPSMYTGNNHWGALDMRIWTIEIK